MDLNSNPLQGIYLAWPRVPEGHPRQGQMLHSGHLPLCPLSPCVLCPLVSPLPLPGVLISRPVCCDMNTPAHLLGGHFQFQELSLPAEHVPGRVDLHKPDTRDFGLEREKGPLVVLAARAPCHLGPQL